MCGELSVIFDYYNETTKLMCGELSVILDYYKSMNRSVCKT